VINVCEFLEQGIFQDGDISESQIGINQLP
jgi:hypothetical protein